MSAAPVTHRWAGRSKSEDLSARKTNDKSRQASAGNLAGQAVFGKLYPSFNYVLIYSVGLMVRSFTHSKVGEENGWITPLAWQVRLFTMLRAVV